MYEFGSESSKDNENSDFPHEALHELMVRAAYTYLMMAGDESILKRMICENEPICLDRYLSWTGLSYKQAFCGEEWAEIPDFLYQENALLATVRYPLPIPDDLAKPITFWNVSDDNLVPGETGKALMLVAAYQWLENEGNEDEILEEMVCHRQTITLASYLERIGKDASRMTKDEIANIPAFLWQEKALGELLGVEGDVGPYEILFGRGGKLPEVWSDYSRSDQQFHIDWALKLLEKRKMGAVRGYLRKFPEMADLEPRLALYKP